MKNGLVIVGIGGHGREVLTIARAAGMPVRGFVDDSPSQRNLDRVSALGVPFLGPSTRLVDERPSIGYVIGIGDPRIRARLDEQLRLYGLAAATLVHPAATIGPDACVGEGFVAFAGARVTTNVRIGRHVHLNQNCTVGHDTELADFVQVNPSRRSPATAGSAPRCSSAPPPACCRACTSARAPPSARGRASPATSSRRRP